MEHITAIQELVDQHKQEMPTGVATALMQKCQDAYDAQPKLYKLTWTMVDSHAHVVEVETQARLCVRRALAQDADPHCRGGRRATRPS